MYIDETGIQTQMYRQYARSKRGKRVNIRISGKHHARIGLVAAQCEGALFAPHTYSGTMNASVFEDLFGVLFFIKGTLFFRVIPSFRSRFSTEDG